MNTMLKVGETIPEFKAGIDKIQTDIDDAGITLRILIDSPTSSEITAIRKENFQIVLSEKDGILFFCYKFNNMQWMDTPYHKQFSKNLTALQDLTSTQGYALTVILADSKTGRVEGIRLVGLSNKFSNELKNLVENQVPINNYDSVLNGVYNNYSTKDLLRFDKCKCKI